jgi:hypothetical protein
MNEEAVVIDSLAGVVFGNIEVHNYSPLTAELLEDLETGQLDRELDGEKIVKVTNCKHWISIY